MNNTEQNVIKDLINQSPGAGKGELNTPNSPEGDNPGGISIPTSQLPGVAAGDTVTLEVVSVTEGFVNLRKAGTETEAPAPEEETPTPETGV